MVVLVMEVNMSSLIFVVILSHYFFVPECARSGVVNLFVFEFVFAIRHLFE